MGGHTQGRISSPNPKPSPVLQSEFPRSAVSQCWSSSPFPAPGTMRSLYFQEPRGAAGFLAASGASSPLCLSRCGRGAPVSWRLGLALDFLTKEVGGSPRSFPLPGENCLFPYIHKYIRGTDKSSLFRNKPRRPAGSPWPCRTRLERREGERRGPRGSGVTLQIPTKDNET